MFVHCTLHFLHVFYIALVSVLAWIKKHNWRCPNSLAVSRSKLPAHLCLNLVANDGMNSEELEGAFLECLRRVVGWCREVGIATLTVYDRDGVYLGLCCTT